MRTEERTFVTDSRRTARHVLRSRCSPLRHRGRIVRREWHRDHVVHEHRRVHRTESFMRSSRHIPVWLLLARLPTLGGYRRGCRPCRAHRRVLPGSVSHHVGGVVGSVAEVGRSGPVGCCRACLPIACWPCREYPRRLRQSVRMATGAGDHFGDVSRQCGRCRSHCGTIACAPATLYLRLNRLGSPRLRAEPGGPAVATLERESAQSGSCLLQRHRSGHRGVGQRCSARIKVATGQPSTTAVACRWL